MYKITLSIFLLFSFLKNDINSSENDKIDAKQLIVNSQFALKKIANTKDLSNFSDYLKNSKAILIFPEVYEGGLFFGAKGGNGILLIKRDNNWSGPFFYTIGALSIGLQVGIKSGTVVMTIMSDRGLKSIIKERIKFGVDVDVAVVDEGVGFSAESTLRLADIFSFSDNSGLFLGGSLEGSYLQPRNDYNKKLHEESLESSDILNKGFITKSSKNFSTLINDILLSK
tara:strand:+ start:1842 stop:2522 length:681 start_codon:yes stop_codon:yes gene_type:complete